MCTFFSLLYGYGVSPGSCIEKCCVPMKQRRKRFVRIAMKPIKFVPGCECFRYHHLTQLLQLASTLYCSLPASVVITRVSRGFTCIFLSEGRHHPHNGTNYRHDDDRECIHVQRQPRSLPPRRCSNECVLRDASVPHVEQANLW